MNRNPTPEELAELGIALVPVHLTPAGERIPLVKWRGITKPASPDTVRRWITHAWTYQGAPVELAAFAMVCGAPSGRIVLDFDKPGGPELCRAWNLRPHVQSRSGGNHYHAPYVPGIESRNKERMAQDYGLPDCEIKSDGRLCHVLGLREGEYNRWLRPPDELDSLDQIPAAVQTAWKHKPRPTPGPVPEIIQGARAEWEWLLNQGLERAGNASRNDAGFWLACQLRDNEYTEPESESILYLFADTVTSFKRDPYTRHEAQQSVRSAFKRGRRDPIVQGFGKQPARKPTAASAHHSEGQTSSAAAAGASDTQAAPQDTGEPIAPPQPVVFRPADPPEPAAVIEPDADKLAESAYESHAWNDAGNADKLAATHGRNIRFIHGWNKWFIWNGKRFREDQTDQIVELAIHTMRQLYKLAADHPDPKQSHSLIQWALKSQSAAAIRNMIELAKPKQPIAITSLELDADPMLIGAQNGTVDLRTGTLRPHDRADLITQQVAAKFRPEYMEHPAAACPLFMQYLHRILPDPELIAFLQRGLGYALTGESVDKAMFILYGEAGNNGKTTLVKTIRKILGSYAAPIPIGVLMNDRFSQSHGPSPELVRLRGIRFAVTSEVKEGARLDEAKVKQLTGGDVIRVRDLYSTPIDLNPSWKIFMDTNHRPVISGSDPAIWNRIKAIPFNVTIPPDEIDTTLPARLMTEADAIFTWMVQGCMEYQRAGLEPPAASLAATADYRNEMDIVGQFLDECCELLPTARTGATDLYQTFRTWCEDNGHHAPSQNAMGRRLTERKLTKQRDGRGNWYVGVRILHRSNRKENQQDTGGVYDCVADSTKLSSFSHREESLPTSPTLLHDPTQQGENQTVPDPTGRGEII